MRNNSNLNIDTASWLKYKTKLRQRQNRRPENRSEGNAGRHATTPVTTASKMANTQMVVKKRKRGRRMAGGSTSRRKTSQKLDAEKNSLLQSRKQKCVQHDKCLQEKQKQKQAATTTGSVVNAKTKRQQWRSKCRHNIIGVCAFLFFFCFEAQLKLLWKNYIPIGSSEGYAYVFCAISIGNELDCLVDVFDQKAVQHCAEQYDSKSYAYCGTLCNPDIYILFENQHIAKLMIGGWEIYRSEYSTANMTQKNRTLTETIRTGDHSYIMHRKYISIMFPDLLTSECPQMGRHVPVPNRACLWMPKLWCWLPPNTNERVIHMHIPQHVICCCE